MTARRPPSDEAREAADRRHELEIRVDRIGGLLVVAPIGDIDIVTGGVFLEALIAAVAAGESQLIVDLGRVPFMDSTGLAILLSAHRALTNINGLPGITGQLRVVAGSRLGDIFDFPWVDRHFPIHADVDDAVQAFNAGGPSVQPLAFERSSVAFERSSATYERRSAAS
jgi:anti-sigma B factor antagonist